MAPKKQQQIKLNLDKVDRKLVAQIKAMKPEYASLELYQVAKMELRNRLLEQAKKDTPELHELREYKAALMETQNKVDTLLKQKIAETMNPKNAVARI